MRPSTIPLLSALLLPASGCCSFARFFCGPDRSEWVSVDHSTPERAVRTLLEALRRDAPEVVYDTFSSDHRRRLGLDRAKTLLVWETVREQYPWLHVAGYAEVPAAVRTGPDTARVELVVEGQPVVVDLVRTLQWFVHYRRPNGTLGDPGEYVVRAGDLVTLTADPDEQRSTLVLRPLVFRHAGLDDVPVDELEAAGVRREWKVDRLAVPETP